LPIARPHLDHDLSARPLECNERGLQTRIQFPAALLGSSWRRHRGGRPRRTCLITDPRLFSTVFISSPRRAATRRAASESGWES
jgi:hypothetical protein